MLVSSGYLSNSEDKSAGLPDFILTALAWYDWYPDDIKQVDMTINAGDNVTLSVTTTGVTSGAAIIENHTTGQRVNQSLSSPHEICRVSADWIVQEFPPSDALYPFADFGTLTFSDANVTYPGGEAGPATAQIIDDKMNGKYWCALKLTQTDIIVKFIGD
jgi:hypothetical protein